MSEPTPAVIAISSHVSRGAVGNRAIVFALETVGVPVWAVQTVFLPYHPGHGRATRIEPEPERFAALLDDLLASRWIGEVGAVLTGYMASAAQAKAVARFVGGLRRLRPGLVHLCDPVIGDRAGLYVDEAVAEAIRDRLLADADIATPNVHELAWLVGAGALDGVDAVAAAARRLGTAETVVTSAPATGRNRIANLLVTRDRAERALLAAHRRVDGPPNGPGDATAGLYLAHRVLGADPDRALAATTASVFELVARAARRGSDEMMLAVDRASLLRPKAAVDLRSIVTAAPVRVRPATGRTLVGVDGCRAGWIAVSGRGAAEDVRIFADFASLVASFPDDAVIAVDMPIGLPARAAPGGRGPERAIRALLDERRSSVFSIPARAAVEAPDYAAACAVALATSDPPRKVSRQAFGIFPRIREVDALMDAAMEARVYEVHPELAFWRLNGGRAMSLPKKVKGRVHPPGMAQRRDLLVACGFPPELLEGRPPAGAAEDDRLDAAACFMIAARIADGTARPFPDPPLATERGARMAIWA